MQMIKKQCGMSLLSMTAIATIVAIVALVVIKLFPIYVENGQVRSVMSGVVEMQRGKEMSIREVREALMRRFGIEGIRGVSHSDIEIELDQSGLALYLDYEVRTGLFSNIELVVTFEESASNTGQ